MVAEAFDRANVEPYCTAADLGTVESESLAAAANNELNYYTLSFEAAAELAGVPSEDAPAVARAYYAIGGHSDVECLPGAKDVLRHCNETYTLGLITNGLKEIQQKKVDTLGIREWFETLVFATPEQGYKPDPAPFEQALSDLDIASNETVHVGNSRVADVAGAHAAGIHSIWIPYETPHEEATDNGPEPEQTLDTLHDLKAVLKMDS
ncbi:HAD-IA family hydrolase (plasmid) [Halocatena salina]|uniref:HAD-IA family hydrolase n=2 Tax=Halocatena salina TaxID=2934340 RepID=A0A8U0A8N5_9EURY|nr:HAD-IA family hydrolase [Halocatena salina]